MTCMSCCPARFAQVWPTVLGLMQHTGQTVLSSIAASTPRLLRSNGISHLRCMGDLGQLGIDACQTCTHLLHNATGDMQVFCIFLFTRK